MIRSSHGEAAGRLGSRGRTRRDAEGERGCFSAVLTLEARWTGPWLGCAEKNGESALERNSGAEEGDKLSTEGSIGCGSAGGDALALGEHGGVGAPLGQCRAGVTVDVSGIESCFAVGKLAPVLEQSGSEGFLSAVRFRIQSQLLGLKRPTGRGPNTTPSL